MGKDKLSNNIKHIDFDNINIDLDIDRDINEYIQDFNIDKNEIEKIYIPDDLNKSVNQPFNEVKKEKRKNIRSNILDAIIVIIILIPVVGVIKPQIFEAMPTIYPIFKNINKIIQIDNLKSLLGISDENEVIEGSVDSSINTIYIEEEDVSKPNSNNEAIKLIHSLANTLIKADYKWQCSEVTPKTIKIALEGVEKIEDNYDRMHLRNSLTKWKKGDFSNAVEVHNYVWEMLDGSVGKAHNLDTEKINEIVNKYFK